MSAIITDQLRILNAKNFVLDATSSDNSYYSFVGLPNATDYDLEWDNNQLHQANQQKNSKKTIIGTQ